MLINSTRSHLLLVDFQARLMPAIDAGEAALARAVKLSQAAQMLDVPIVRTEQYPGGLGGTVEALSAFGTMVEKVTFSARGSAAFEAIALRPQLVVAGCETHVCVLQTVLDLVSAHTVFVVADAVGSRRAADKAIALERMRDAGAVIVTSEMVMFEWLQSCKHPRFREMSGLIK